MAAASPTPRAEPAFPADLCVARSSLRRAPVTLTLRFDRGTLRIDDLPPGVALPLALWDGRTACARAPAYAYGRLAARVAEGGLAVEDHVLSRRLEPAPVLRPPPLRDYQHAALDAWRARGAGLVVLPTGAGKTRVAVAAIAASRVPALVLCPTRALLDQWAHELARFTDGPVGVVGDGERRLEPLTVMTYASASRWLDQHGAAFGLVVADEAHHAAAGAAADALAMCAAPLRLGLTATAPRPGSADEASLDDLVGPIVAELGVADLTGTHLAPLDVVRLEVTLSAGERERYERAYRPFSLLRGAFARSSPGADWASLVRALSVSAEGRAALAGFQEASALAAFPAAKRALVASLLARHREDRVLVFAASTRDVYAIALDNLVPVVTAEIGRPEREEILERYRAGRYRAIVSARVLNEGLDVPDASVAVVAGGSLGEREHVQRVGRVLRPGPDKRALVYELVTAGTLDRRRAANRSLHHDRPR
jgi:superfamily II DNA or RNA helicase